MGQENLEKKDHKSQTTSAEAARQVGLTTRMEAYKIQCENQGYPYHDLPHD